MRDYDRAVLIDKNPRALRLAQANMIARTQRTRARRGGHVPEEHGLSYDIVPGDSTNIQLSDHLRDTDGNIVVIHNPPFSPTPTEEMKTPGYDVSTAQAFADDPSRAAGIYGTTVFEEILGNIVPQLYSLGNDGRPVTYIGLCYSPIYENGSTQVGQIVTEQLAGMGNVEANIVHLKGAPIVRSSQTLAKMFRSPIGVERLPERVPEDDPARVAQENLAQALQHMGVVQFGQYGVIMRFGR
jgi:hypothetical protein